MHDIKWIREHPDAFDHGLKRRGLEAKSPDILAIDTKRRDGLTRLNDLQQQRNETAKAVGMAKKNGEDAEPIMARAKAINENIKALEEETRQLEASLDEALSSLPNLLAEDVPDGSDESDNREVRSWGEKPAIDREPRQHFELGEALGQMDFETAAKISGARFVLLSGPLARMERALASFMLDLHTQEYGYTEVVPPYLVQDSALFGTGQLPKFAEDCFRTTDDRWLIPTAEVPLTNILAGEILSDEQLPRRYTAYTPCFRSEAGSAGRDTRGMIRQHQFSKVELVSITTPEESDAEQERMTSIAEEVLKRLGLAYRVMLLCSGDTGFSARRTYDLEVWLPGQNAYREISSCSTCGDFQARRMKARFRRKGEKQTEFLHTLNGSALAVGRTMVAVLENYQQADGSIAIPDVLQPYMGGLKTIEIPKAS